MVEFQPDLEEAETWSSWQHILKNLILAMKPKKCPVLKLEGNIIFWLIKNENNQTKYNINFNRFVSYPYLKK